MSLDVSALLTLIRRRAPLHRFVPAIARRLPGSSEFFGPPRRILSNADHASRYGARWTVVVPAHEPRRPPPVTFHGQHLDYGCGLAATLPDAGLLRLKNARVVPAQGWVIGEGDCYLPDNAWSGWELTPFNQTIYRHWRLGPQTQLPGVSLNLTSEFAGTNYAHFLLDALARLHLFLVAGNEIASLDHVILPTWKFSILPQFLAAFGIPAAKIVTPETGQHLRCEWLWAPSYPGRRRNRPSWIVDFWRRSLGAPASPPSRRFFLSRRGYKRRLVNYNEIEPVLASRGFEQITVGSPPSWFAEASVVVGEYGAALANIAFCQPGTKIVELTPPGHALPGFYSLATAGAMPFHAVLGAYPKGTRWPINTQSENFRIDPVILSEALDSILS